jgi:hypothetical protein
MKRVAVLAPEFVPSSRPPALRVRFFVSHLREFGWEPVVITTDAAHYDCPLEQEGEALLPAGLEVIRTAALPARLTRWIGVGDVGMRSLYHHWRALRELCRERRPDLLFIPVPPYVPMVLGRLLHARCGVPYVVDYIDPWVTEYYWTLPRAQRPPKWPLAYALSRVLEPFALGRAAHLTAVSQGTLEGVLQRRRRFSAQDATEIPYGGEPADFERLRARPRPNRVFDGGDGRLHVSYVGAVVPSMYAPLRALLGAVRRGRDAGGPLFQRLRLHFVGTQYAASAAGEHRVLPIAQEQGVADLVEEQPARLGYLDALQVLLDSHALLVLGSEEPHYTASKLFPYILARRPLLALVHEASSVVSILRETGAGPAVCFGPGRPLATAADELQHGLGSLLDAADRGTAPATRWEAFEAYTARAMARRLAGAFDAALRKAAGPAERDAG